MKKEIEAKKVGRLFAAMLRIRRVEEEIIRVYSSDKVKSPVHLSIGQESIAVGVCDNLRPTDILYATYRGHAAYLAKGGNINRMMAELWGKSDGLASGKAGSMHLGDRAAGMIGTSAIVATGIPLAVGNALAMKMQQKDVVTTVFFGEGATDEGVFHESMNFAALKKLPILFVCENNQYERTGTDLCTGNPRGKRTTVPGMHDLSLARSCRAWRGPTY